MTPQSDVVVWLEGYWPGLRDELGGKAAGLGAMLSAGLPVPPGFAVTTTAYRRVSDAGGLDEALARHLGGLDPADTVRVSERCARIREIVVELPVPEEVEAAIRTSYAELSRRCGVIDVPVAVRSSARAEDSPDASFAGEHDTFLWVRGADAVVDAVRRCWAGLFTDRAACYRLEMGYPHRGAQMGVLVQKMVHPRSAGVAFTLNPVDGDRSQVAIDSAWGFGEAVVAGEVTPDHFLVDKVVHEVTRRVVSAKEHEFVLGADDRVHRVATDPARVGAPSLSDAEIRAVARLARTAEKLFGVPQDIEWALDRDLPEGSNVVLLQVRPETVWSRRRARTGAPAHDPSDFMSSIVTTLLSPLHAEDAGDVARE